MPVKIIDLRVKVINFINQPLQMTPINRLTGTEWGRILQATSRAVKGHPPVRSKRRA